MATITLSNPLFYKAGSSGVSEVVGYEDNSRRVARYTFTAPSTGATGISLNIPTAGKGAGSHISIKYYIGTDPSSHANAGAESAATGTLTIGSDWLTFTGEASILLIPGATYYLWIFPGEDTFGWYQWWSSKTATLTTSGAARSVISGSNGTLGAAHTLNLTRYNSSLTHTIKATCGDAELTIATGVQADTVSWTPPISWAAQNTTGTTVVAVITCTTYSGTAPIGSTDVTLTFAIPASVVPSVSFSVADKLGYLSTYGSYVQGKSQAAVTAQGTGIHGSTITGYVITCGTQSKTGASTVFDLPTSGTVTITVKVTDSRGRTATASKSITVAAYSPPSAAITSAYRCDADGNEDSDGAYAIVIFNASVTSLSSKNSAAYKLKHRVRGTSSWSSVALDSLSGNYTPTGASHIVSVSTDSAYEFSVEVTDDFGAVSSPYRIVQIAFALMQIKRSTKSIGLGTRANLANTVLFGLAAMFNKGLRIKPVVISSFDDIDAPLTAIVENLDYYAIDFQCFQINGSFWHCIVFKTSNEYATVEFFSYAGRRQKLLLDGVWSELKTIR